MDTKVVDGPNARFRSRDVTGSAFADEAAADVAANAADVALLIDQRGVIRDAAFPGEEFHEEDFNDWVGRKWSDLVRPDSHDKIADLLSDEHSRGQRRWRHVNHIVSGSDDLPVRYFTLATSKPDWTLAIGRDLRAASSMQQRLIEAQRSMERDYARVREAETRFRLLFQLAAEGVMIIDGDSFKITDVNSAASRLLGRSSQRLEGRALDDAFGAASAGSVRETLAVARKTGRTEQIELTPAGAKHPCTLLVSVYRQGRKVYFLTRLSASEDADESEADASLAQLATILPDGLILTGEDGKILSVNDAFLEMAQINHADNAVGAPVEQFLGRSETELNVLMANLREHGSIRNFSTSVRSPQNLTESVDVSAVAAPGPTGTVFGFSLRRESRGLSTGRRAQAGTLPSSADQLSDLVGRVALKEIVRESTDMIERSCIEAALELTNNNRASAAEILGLSRQSLYAKMHRHKIGALPAKSEH